MKQLAIGLCALVAFLTYVSAAQQSHHAELQEIVRLSNALSAKYCDLSDQEAQGLHPEFEALDWKLSEKLRSLFQARQEFKSVQKVTDGAIEWREWPTDIDHAARVDFQLDKNKMLQVNYRHHRLADGASIYFLANSFWNTSHRGRVNSSMYIIIVREGEAFIETLPGLGFHDLCAIQPELSPCFLGFVSNSTSRPSIAFVEGPYGSGGFSKVYLYCYDDEKKVWAGRCVAEYDGAGGFSYDEKEAKLVSRVNVHEPNRETRRKDIILSLRHRCSNTADNQ